MVIAGNFKKYWCQEMHKISELRKTVEIACPVCGESKGKPLFSVKDWSFQCSESNFSLRKCSACGCGYLSPRPAEEDMPGYYPKEFYWSWEGADNSISWDEIIERRRDQIERKSAWLCELKPGRLLDVGAQKGEFIWYMRERGWQCEGVEMDHSIPNPANMPIRYGDFLSMDFELAKYDVITFWAVLEHVYNPAVFIDKAAKLLKPGGRLVILVTNLNSIQSRVLCQDDYPRHLTIFTKSALKTIFSKNGLRISRSSTDQKIFGGALSGGFVYLCKRLCGYDRDEVFSEWKQLRDPHLFWAKWKGNPSSIIRWISRLDRFLTKPIEAVLDRLGYGFILTVTAEKERT